MELLFAPFLTKYGPTIGQAAQAAAIATAILIHHFVKYLEPNAGVGLAAFAFIGGLQNRAGSGEFS
jgi:hypothetical protein